jgi:hypothetical protein
MGLFPLRLRSDCQTDRFGGLGASRGRGDSTIQGRLPDPCDGATRLPRPGRSAFLHYVTWCRGGMPSRKLFAAAAVQWSCKGRESEEARERIHCPVRGRGRQLQPEYVLQHTCQAGHSGSQIGQASIPQASGQRCNVRPEIGYGIFPLAPEIDSKKLTCFNH